jgi:hypothetical protein
VATQPIARTDPNWKDLVRAITHGLEGGTSRLVGRLAELSNATLVSFVALALFVLAAWPLLLVDLPPLLDLPNHIASAHIASHLYLYPQYVFNGYFKSNSLLTLWLHIAGDHGLLGAARAFTAVVLAVNALALPIFVLHFAGRRCMLVATLFVWPLVHGFFLSMGMLNFAIAFPLSLILLTVIDRQRQEPRFMRGLGIAVLSGVLWYAHPFPLAVVVGLVILDIVTRPTWRARMGTSITLLSPLAPVGMLLLVTTLQHLVKAGGSPASASTTFAYLPPWELVLHYWLDASGALTRWGSMTIVPALLLPYFAWKRRQIARPLFSNLAMVILAGAYLCLPTMLSNWWYLNCRLVPFLWVGTALRVPATVPKPIAVALAACALLFSVVTGFDYVRLDHDRAAFTAGLDAVPERATLLPLLFKHRRTSDFTASLTHAWGYYVIAKNTSAPLVFAVERSYPITYRIFPPAALIPPALDRFAELRGTPSQLCKSFANAHHEGDADCTLAWHKQWSDFWREAEPRFSHLLTWAIPSEARPLIPRTYRRTFAADDLEIYARQPALRTGGTADSDPGAKVESSKRRAHPTFDQFGRPSL